MINPDKIEIEQRLKACPFCGGPAEKYPGHGPHMIQCGNCMAEGPVRGPRQSAIEGWNSRFETTLTKTGWRPISEAPRDGTWLELVVDYTDGGAPLHDAIISPTIGFNNFENDGEDEWKFAGWSWTHDYICQGSGEVIAWRPSRLNASDDGLGPLPSATPSHSPANQGEGEVFERIKPFVDAIPQPIRNAQLRHVPTPEREIFVPSALKITPTPQPAEAEARALYSMAHDPCIGSEEAVSRIAAALQGKAEAERENDALARDRNDLTEALLLSEAQLAERTREKNLAEHKYTECVIGWNRAIRRYVAAEAERDKLVEALKGVRVLIIDGSDPRNRGELLQAAINSVHATLSTINAKEPE